MTSHSITPIYTARASATGGREGSVHTDDGVLELNLKRPGVDGSDPKATNPEQLFAAAFAACYQGALFGAGREQRLDLANSVVAVDVSIGKDESGGSGLSARIQVFIPDTDLATVQQLAEKAHQNCPYSKATRGNIDVAIEAVESL